MRVRKAPQQGFGGAAIAFHVGDYANRAANRTTVTTTLDCVTCIWHQTTTPVFPILPTGEAEIRLARAEGRPNQWLMRSVASLYGVFSLSVWSLHCYIYARSTMSGVQLRK
jgi:hypothetical protein